MPHQRSQYPLAIPALEFRNVFKSFDGKKTVLEDINFKLNEGDILCLLGASGCGKSTTLRIASGIERESTGEVYSFGEMMSSPHCFVPPEARNIGLMFQDFALFPHMNVAQNIGFGLRSPAPERVNELLERINLSGYQNKYPHELSGGEQQRVALARALAVRPKTLLMDEPFSGLDDRLRDLVRENCLEIVREEKMSALLVTHDPSEAMQIADHIVLMRDGRIVQEGAPYNIYNNPVDAKAAAFFSDINHITGFVKNSQVDTPFGRFFAPGYLDGDKVDIVIRPQHIRIDFDRGGLRPTPTAKDGAAARGFVERARYLGRESLVKFRLEATNEPILASVRNVFLPNPGTPFWLSIRRDKCYVFKA